ncbi:MAG: hypothetical protein WBF17_18260, partial [Phycisphaerae bacterium]
LATLSLYVPPDMPEGTITIEVVIDQFFDGQQLIATDPGPPFTLIIIPEPMSLTLALPGALLLRRRRRSRSTRVPAAITAARRGP